MTLPTRFSSSRTALVCLAALLSAAPAFALYKVIGPDGKVSFTDKPPLNVGDKVQPINPGRGGPAVVNAALPAELRQAAQRYPVTLYVTRECSSCDAGRDLLKSRGVPFTEKTVTSNADGDALQRLTGSRDLPVVSIGDKTLRGLQRDEWVSYLDAAGYPKESRLPANYQQAAASPLVPPPSTPAPAARTVEPGSLPAAPEPATPGPGGFRF